MNTLDLQFFPKLKSNRPEKIIQFGEGNFIRAFMDWMIHQMNKKGTFNGQIVAIQPTPHGKIVSKLNAQNGLFTVILRGVLNGQIINNHEVITSISRGINPYTNWQEVLKCAENPEMEFVFSNTTEAGLIYNPEDAANMTPPLSYPAKLTLFLYHRYKYFNGAKDKGMYIIPCELLENNGELLKNILLKYCEDWNLPKEFKTWLKTNNKFYNSLVDRVVSGYPKDAIETITQKLGYKDTLVTCGEPFHFLALEGDKSLNDKLPFIKSDLNVVIEKDITKYRQRKVRLLNGGHTANVPASFLAGLDTVSEMMDDEITGKFARQTIKNIILPSISMDKQMLENFADAVIERFQNPFIKHQLLSILLNCTSKFKVRVLPSLIQYYEKFNIFPQNLCFSFAAYIYLYKSNNRNGQFFEFIDDNVAIKKLHTAWQLYDNSLTSANNVAMQILNDTELWGIDLSIYPKLIHDVGKYLYEIDINGTKKIMQSLLTSEE